MIGFLLALLLWMLGHGSAPGPAPAPHRVTVAPAAPAPAAVVRPAGAAPGWSSEGPRRPAAPTVAAPPADPGDQLPTEVIGRAITCPDGTDGQIVAADLSTDCRRGVS